MSRLNVAEQLRANGRQDDHGPNPSRSAAEPPSTDRSRSPRARSSILPTDQAAATTSATQDDTDDTFVGEEEAEEEEVTEDPPIDPDDQASIAPAAALPESSSSLMPASNESAPPTPPASPRALGTPVSAENRNPEVEVLPTPEGHDTQEGEESSRAAPGSVAADQLPETHSLPEALWGAGSRGRFYVLRFMSRPKRFIVSKSKATSSPMPASRMTA